MKTIKEDIKKGAFQRLYVFYGEERYLMQRYEKALSTAIVPADAKTMNLSVFQGKETTAEALIDAAETLPFLNEYRLIVAKDTGLFAAGRKEESDKMSAYAAEIAQQTVMLFVESDLDKRNGLYKKSAKAGRVIEFKTPQEKDLRDWIIRYCADEHKKITAATATRLLRTAANDMVTLAAEMDKLIAYQADGKEITAHDIAAICTPSLESRIFDLVGAIGNKNAPEALDRFDELLRLKESPILVLTMIARQFRLILLCKHLAAKRLPSEQIADKLGIRGFVVRECLAQANRFTMDTLKRAFEDCLTTDVKIKTGQLQDRLAIELLILSTTNA